AHPGGKAEYGSGKRKPPVELSTFSPSPAPLLVAIYGVGVGVSSLFWYISSNQNRKSSAVKGCPSLQRIPRRRWKVMRRPSALTSQPLAMFGTSVLPV